MKIGIAICTFNRIETLLQTLNKIQIYTKSSHDLIVIDDGSCDGTVDELKKIGVKFLSCRNRGIAWNKNRAIFYLKNFTKSDVIIVFEDDTFPIEPYWEDRWVKGILLWGHINLSARHWGIAGCHDEDGSAERPFKSHHVSAQCAGFSSECIDYVGYMDSRFRSYGMEHVEHTNRMLKAGYGGELLNDTKRQIYYLIDSPMEILFRDTSVGLDNESRDKSIAKNMEIFLQIQNDKIRRDPWINDEEMCVFLSEYNKFREKELYFSIKNSEGLILCFDSVYNKIIFLPLGDMFPLGRFQKILCHYDGRKLSLYTKIKYQINYLKFSSLSNVDIDSKEISPEKKLEFDVILDKKKGMYLVFNGLYASCEKNNSNLFTLNRKIPLEWECFYFCCFENT